MRRFFNEPRFGKNDGTLLRRPSADDSTLTCVIVRLIAA